MLNTCEALLCYVMYRIVTRYCIGIRIVSWKNVLSHAHVPSGDAVSIPREFDNEFANFKSENEKRKSSINNESLIHSPYFGLNRRAIAAIEIATITELSTFSATTAIIVIIGLS